jgi:universal stress protein E
VRKALRSGARLIVKDTHHHHALKRSVFSNTDWNLIRTCPLPLWLVKPRAISEPPVLLAAVDPMHEHDRPAELDHEILAQATAVAAACGGSLHVLHVYDPMPALTGSAAYPVAAPVALPVDSVAERMREAHGRALGELAGTFDLADEHVHLLRGAVRDTLVDQAERLNADAVVMGAVARGALRRMLIGSTAEAVLDRLPCDVLLIKPRGFGNDVD